MTTPDPSAPLCPCGVRGCTWRRFHAITLGGRKRKHSIFRRG